MDSLVKFGLKEPYEEQPGREPHQNRRVLVEGRSAHTNRRERWINPIPQAGRRQPLTGGDGQRAGPGNVVRIGNRCRQAARRD